jgi:hypothetical protein
LGMFVSFDDGGDWQSLDLNLPPVPITDLSLRHDKLVAATQGRGFWVLDDLFMVHQVAGKTPAKPLHVFTPGTTTLARRGGGARNFEGANPDRGVPLYYYLENEPEGPLSIDILDSDGNMVRSYSSEEGDFERCKISNMDPRDPFKLKYPPTKKGLNKWLWDKHRQGINCIENITFFYGFDGPTIAPGAYSARLSVDESVQTVSFSVDKDPRVTATDEQVEFWSERLQELSGLLNVILTNLDTIRASQRQIEALMAKYPGDKKLQQAGTAAIELITDWDGKIIQVLHQTGEDEDAWETMLAGQFRFLMDVIDETGAPVTEGALERLDSLKAEWSQRLAELQTIKTEYIDGINKWAQQQGVPHVASPGE